MKLHLTLSVLFIFTTGFPALNRSHLHNPDTLSASTLNYQAGPDTLKINKLNRLAANYFESNPDSTLYYSRKSINLSRKIGYKAGLADGLLQAAHANYFKGRFENAKHQF